VVLPIALMDSNGFLELQKYSDSDADSSASLIVDFRPEQAVVRKSYVPSFAWEKIETHFADRSPSFVKIDVEGAELEVLRTLQPMLFLYRPWLAVEILPVYRENNSSRLERQEAIEAILKDNGYVIYRVKRDALWNLTHLERLDTIGVHGLIADCDYLMVPAEALDRLAALSLTIVAGG
jgi:hypothetical protein